MGISMMTNEQQVGGATQEDDPWLSPKDIKQTGLLPVSESTIRGLMKREMVSVQIGRLWFTRLSHFRAWLGTRTKREEERRHVEGQGEEKSGEREVGAVRSL